MNKGTASEHGEAFIARKIALWKAACERGNASILADALVKQREVPERLKHKLGL